jgi:hypothetical protein
MAYESVTVTPGVGAAVGGDTVGGVFFQAVKLDIGADGALSGPVSASNPLPAIAALLSTDFSEAAINAAANGDNTIVAAGGASNKIRVWGWWFKVNGAGVGVSAKWKDGAASDYHPALPFNDKDGWVMGFNTRPWFTGTANTALILNLSAAIQVSGRVYYKVGT